MKFLIAFFSALALVVLVGMVGAYPTKWMVNYLFSASLLVSVFGTSSIGFWQALVLNVLAGFLVKGSK